jgi:hypothetical protein
VRAAYEQAVVGGEQGPDDEDRQLSTGAACPRAMTSIRSRSLPVVLVTLALLTGSGTGSGAGAYAAERPHTHEGYVARTTDPTAPTPFPTSGLSVGDPPAIPYAFASEPEFGGGDWRLQRVDGTSLRLTGLSWSVWAPMGDGAIGMAGTEAGPELQRVTGAGHVHTRMVAHFGLAVSPDHEIVGWLGDHGAPHVVEGGGARHFTLPRVGHGRTIATIAGTRTCQEAAPEGGGCTVFVDGAHHPWVSTSHGIVTSIGPMLRVSDVNQHGRVLGLVDRRTSDRGTCWGVFRAGGHQVFRTCDHYLDSFSPNGHRVLAERSQVKWASVRRLAILDRAGDMVRSWTFDPGPHRSLSQLTWEDDHHLLAVLRAHGQWGIVRIGTDGSVEYAGEPVDAVNEFTPYSLPLR